MTESLSLKCFCTRQGEVARLRFVFTLDTLKITVAAAVVVVVLVGVGVGIGTIVTVALEMGVGVVKPITHYHRLQDQTNPTARYKLLFASYRFVFLQFAVSSSACFISFPHVLDYAANDHVQWRGSQSEHRNRPGYAARQPIELLQPLGLPLHQTCMRPD